MAGRPKLPVAIKKQRGTFRNYDKDQEEQEEQLKEILPEGKLKVPKIITNPEVRKAYRNHIELLRALGGAAEQNADSPLLEEAYFCLQESLKARENLQFLEYGSELYNECLSLHFKLFTKYSATVKQFYLTPQARVKLKLDALTATEKQLNISEKKSAVAKLLEEKQS